jgi:serine/threonine-protein kinase
MFGDYALDVERGCLLRGGEPVHLRPQSYEVLKYLAENPGRLISKNRLIEEVWRGRAVTDDSLVQCLRDVRHALGQHGAQYIRNVRGRGYIFERPDGHPIVKPPAVRADQLDFISVVVEEEDEAAAPTAGSAPAADLGPAARHSLKPAALSRRSATVVAASVLLLVAAGSYWFAASRSPGPTRKHEIARDVSEKLQARWSGGDRQATRPYAANPEAYLLYLRGRYYARKQSEPEIRKGIAFYHQAVDLDPTYALAYAGMADAFRALSIVGRVPSKEAFPQARSAARRALEIDDGLVEAHVALGWIRFSFDWDWIGAEEELRRAISLNPENPDAHRAYGHLLSNLGRHDEALSEIRLARELDPLMLIGNALEGQFLFYAGRNQEAEVRFRKTLDLEPNYWVAHNGLGRVYLLRTAFSDAVAAFTKARALAPETVEPIPQLGYALARWGKRAEARAILKELESRTADHYVPAYNFAMIHHGLGEREQALHYLEQSFEQREVQLTFIRIDTRWDDLRADPRFVAIARRMGLE